MLSWFTGSKMAEDEDRIDETHIETPETPAPVFAVRAFKHAIFGTPQPPPTVAPTRISKTKKELNDQPPVPTLNPSKENVNDTGLNLSPTKRGILKTPGGTTRRKELVWDADVVDNEGKKQSKSGLPNNAPGKFPSPWNPKTLDITEDKKSKVEEKKPKTKLSEKLYDAKATGTSPRGVKGRAKDDADITIDMLEPRSESGRYWKEQYMAYSQKSEEETKKLIAKQKLARDYARKKDEEATELRRQLEHDRKKRHTREASLEVQVKDLREQLRQALAENARTCAEISMLRRQAESAAASQATHVVPAIDAPSASTKSTSPIRISRTQRPQSPDFSASIWNDAAEDSNAPFLSAAMVPDRSRGEPAGERQRRVHRKPATISRQDSVVIAEDVGPKSETRKSGTLTRTLTPRPGSLATTPTRRTLGERDLNSFLSPPAPNLLSPTDFENVAPDSSRKHRRNRDRDVEKPTPDPFLFDASTPLEALSMQAEQPTTPQPPSKETKTQERADRTPVTSSRKHRRTEAKADLPDDRLAAARAKVAMEIKVDLPADRLAAAKARLAARKQKENTRIA